MNAISCDGKNHELLLQVGISNFMQDSPLCLGGVVVQSTAALSRTIDHGPSLICHFHGKDLVLIGERAMGATIIMVCAIKM